MLGSIIDFVFIGQMFVYYLPMTLDSLNCINQVSMNPLCSKKLIANIWLLQQRIKQLLTEMRTSVYLYSFIFIDYFFQRHLSKTAEEEKQEMADHSHDYGNDTELTGIEKISYPNMFFLPFDPVIEARAITYSMLFLTVFF